MRIISLFIVFIFLLNADVVPYDLTADKVDARLKKVNGDTAEYVMNKLLKKNGWKNIEGEVGKRGIDGLFVKYDADGNVKQVMVAEAKYGSSNLGTNKYGTDVKNVRQMSKKGLLHQIDNLIKEYPNNKEYRQIRKHIQSGNYRARLFQLKNLGNTLSFEMKKILPNGDIGIKIEKLSRSEKYKVNGLKIDFNNPKTKFEKSILNAYRHGQYKALIGNFKFSSLDAKEVLSSNKGKLVQGDIEKIMGTRQYVYNSIEREYKSSLRKFKGKYNGVGTLKKKIRSRWKKYWKSLKTGIKKGVK